MRNLLILILVVTALALVRWLVRDVARAVMGALKGSGGSEQKTASGAAQTEANRLVKDPLSGTYIDERVAVKDVIDGQTVFFESNENRDAYRRQRDSG